MAKSELELKKVSNDLIVSYAQEFGGSLSLELVEGVLKEYFLELQKKFVKNRIQGMDPVSLTLFSKIMKGALSFDDEETKGDAKDIVPDKKNVKHVRK